MFHHKWVMFRLPPFSFNPERTHPKELIVYQDEEHDLYFFANSIFACLGYQKPHLEVQRSVLPQNQHRVPLGSGIFLKTETVNDLANSNQEFKAWFNEYVDQCTNFHTRESNCPR